MDGEEWGGREGNTTCCPLDVREKAGPSGVEVQGQQIKCTCSGIKKKRLSHELEGCDGQCRRRLRVVAHEQGMQRLLATTLSRWSREAPCLERLRAPTLDTRRPIVRRLSMIDTLC